MEQITEEQAYTRYNEFLDELQPLEGMACNPFSQLLREGDPIAYNCGFNDFCDGQEFEVED